MGLGHLKLESKLIPPILGSVRMSLDSSSVGQPRLVSGVVLRSSPRRSLQQTDRRTDLTTSIGSRRTIEHKEDP